MRKPLDNWDKLKRTYTFGVPTFYSNFHLGLDLLVPVGTPVYAPLDGVVATLVGPQGGNTIHLKTPTHLIRFLHLSTFKATGPVKEGDIIALTGGKKGALGAGNSTAPHLHVDVSKGTLQLNNTSNFINPDIFFMNKFKLAIINLDMKDTSQLEAALEQRFKDLSGGYFELDCTIIQEPRTDALQNLTAYNQPPVALTGEYVHQVIGDLTGYHSVGVIYHFDGLHPAVNIRPVTFATPQNGMYVLQSWLYEPEDVPGQSALESWLWAITHETLHSMFYRLKDQGVNIRDTVHDEPNGVFTDEFVLIKPYYNQLTGGVTPPHQDMLTEKEVKELQALEGYIDAGGVTYWSGKPLSEYLTSRLNDKIKTIQAAQQ